MTFTKFVLALVLFALPAFAQHSESAKPSDDASATPAAAKSGEPKSAEPKPAEPIKNPLPADKSVPQTITVNGKTLHYTATVGTITLKKQRRQAHRRGDVHGIYAGRSKRQKQRQ
jgi:carboxypeptidase C (cathepsin A)